MIHSYKKWYLAALLALFVLPANAQNLLQRYEPGPRLIDGNQLNQIVDRLNNGIITATYYFTGTAAATDQAFFIASRAMRVVSCREVHAVAAGGTSTLQVVKDTGTSAPGGGTDILATAFNLASTANTVQVGSLSTTAGVTTLAAGDRLSVDFADAIQSSTGVLVTCMLTPLS